MPPLITLMLALTVGTAVIDEPPNPAQRTPDREIPGGIAVELLTAEEAKTAIVDASDPFFSKLTLFDISLRLDRDMTALGREKALVEFRTFLQEQVTDWPEEDRDTLLTALPRIAQACRTGCPKILPKRWRFIRTTGRESSHSPYTRGDCIVLPAGTVRRYAGKSVEQLGKLIVHETFHVYSRLHPAERDAIYAEIGFRPIAPVQLPESIDQIRLTNPDGPGWEHAVTVRDPATGEECRALLLITSRVPRFRKGLGGVLSVVQWHLYPLTADDPPVLRLDASGAAVQWFPFSTPGFGEAIGRNTAYIIHPDEIIADNVALLAYAGPKVASPDLLERIRRHLAPAQKRGQDESKGGASR